jgi:hypothetical protein
MADATNYPESKKEKNYLRLGLKIAVAIELFAITVEGGPRK